MKKIFTFLVAIFLLGGVYAQSWSEIAKELPKNNPYDYEAEYVAIDGDYAVVGAPVYYLTENFGRAFVLYNNGIDWELIATLTPSNPILNNTFGGSVSISGDVIVVGSKLQSVQTAYVFVKPPSGWKTMTETAQLTASDAFGGDYFSSTVSVSGDVVVVGAYLEDDKGNNSGAAYIYEKPSSGWVSMTETAKVYADDAVAGGGFGQAVSISGDVIAVGAPGQGANGATYIFEKPSSGWSASTTSSVKLTTSDSYVDGFSRELCIDGNTVVVAAPWSDDFGNHSGSAFIYTKTGANWTSMTTETAKLLASNGSNNDLFGISPSISGDNIVIGAVTHTATGAAYVYTKPSSGWVNATETAYLTPSAGNQTYFGHSGISGDNIIIGADRQNNLSYGHSGLANIFVKPSSGWVDANENTSIIPTSLSQNLYGQSVSIDGDYAVVGAPGGYLMNGEAYVFYNNNGSWERVAVLTASDGDYNNQFGYSVSIIGNNIVVGAPNSNSEEGSAYVFVKPSSGWHNMEETAVLTASDGAVDDKFGYSVAISNDAVVVGATQDDDNLSNSGSAYVFSKPSSGWADMTQTAKLLDHAGDMDDNFGCSVAISGDDIVVGANLGDGGGADDGIACVYTKPGSGWTNTNETARLRAAGGNLYHLFGNSVSILGDDIVIGAPGIRKTYIFVKPSSGWTDATQTVELTASDISSGDRFGTSVSIKDDKVVVGSINDDDNGSNSGSAYIFDKPSSGWANATEDHKIIASNAVENQNFGSSVSISGESIIVGANHDDELADYSGAVYMFAVMNEQTITFNALAAKTYGDANFTLSATGGASGNPVVFTSSDNSIATCTGTNGETVTIIGAGSCTIYANQAGSTDYLAAPQVQQNLIINAYPVTVTVDAGQTKVYGDVNPTSYTYVADNLLNGDSYSGFLNRDAGEDAGNYAINIWSLTAGANYSINFVTSDFIITKKELTVSVGFGQEKIYNDPDPVIYYNVNGLINGDNLTGALSREAGEDVGTYAVYIGTLTAGPNYNQTFETRDFTITPYHVTVTVDAGQTKVYGDADPVFTYTADNLLNGDTYSGTLNRHLGQDVGSYLYYLGSVSAGPNYQIDFVNSTFEITSKAITVTADTGLNKVYGDVDPTLTYSSDALSYGDSYSGNLSREAGEDVGTYAITQGDLTLSSNYVLSFISNDFEITTKSITVTVDAGQTKAYGSSDPSFTYTGTALSNGDTYTGMLSRESGESVGTYNITQGTLLAGSNYNITFVSNLFEITPKDITVTVDASQSKVYGDSDPVFTYTSTSLENGDSFSGTLDRNVGEDVGTYTITQGSLLAGSNYNLNFVSNNFEITPKAITVTADAGQIKTYGDSEPTFTYTNTALAFSDVFTGSLSRDAGEDVGTYAITQGSLSLSSNYSLSFNSNGFDIIPMDVTVTVDAGQTKVYGNADPTFTYSATSLLNGDTYSGALSRDAGEDVGTYTITQGSLTASSNYNINFMSSDFEISPMDVAVMVDAGQTKVYGDSDPTFTYTATSLLNGDSYSGTLSRDAGEDVGTYAITQGDLTAGANYNINFVADNFEITKANPIISWTTPEDIEEGTALSNTQLNASADVAGVFVYNPAEGTVLALGDNQELTVEFTPDDATNYNVVNTSVFINVVTNVKVSEVSENSISIYPNPTSGFVKLDLGEYSVKEIIISDLKGSIVLRKQNLSRIESLDLSDAIRGVYVVSLVTEQNEIIIRRLIKE